LVTHAYEAFQRDIHSFAFNATRDAETAADITQDAYLRLYREVAGGRAPDNVRAWLYRVAANLIINRARHMLVVDRLRQAWSGPEELAESPEQQVLQAERSNRLRAELERLPREARVGLLLAANGFKGREVANAIGRSELATRSLLCRARLQLRERLAGEEGGL
jgi:RNA polymerase sigma-70 factor (ECF subfamily)